MAPGAFGEEGCHSGAPLGGRVMSCGRLPAFQERSLDPAVRALLHNSARFGTSTDGVKTDIRKVRSRKQDMIDREIEFHLGAYKASGAELIMGNGRFVGPKTLEVTLNDGGSRLLTGNEVVINIGSHATIPAIPGLDSVLALTHIEALELDY